ncbi:hypothetical protein I6I78_16475 [Enterococcus casseliflavus]|nr:hypothetical protein I6I78_16475 [Enterococcus casseliflavus]
MQKKADEVSGSDEPFTEESFFYVCKRIGLDAADMEEMNIGQCLDYIQEWIENNTKEEDKPKAKGRRATQADFNNF